MSKLLVALSTFIALGSAFQHGKKNAAAIIPVPLTEITFNEGNFSGTNGFTVTKNGSGFTADSTYPGGFNISDKTSYLEFDPGSNVAIAGEHGFSIALDLSSKAGATTNVYEQLFTYEASDGSAAYIDVAGLYHRDSEGTVDYSQANGTNKLALDESKKLQIFVVNFDDGTIYDYVNGTLVNQFTSSNSRNYVIADVIETLKGLKKKGESIYLRKPCEAKKSKNTTSIVAGNIKIYDFVVTAQQASKMFEDKYQNIRTDLPIQVNSCDDYSLISYGSGIVQYSSDRANSFNISDATSYLKIKANEGKKLTQDGNGFSLSFYHKSTTDTFYEGNTSLRPNVTDDFEQLITVEGENGASAHICMGGFYFTENGKDIDYSFSRPSGTGKTLLTTNWKYLTINVDTKNNSVRIYMDGEEVIYYDTTIPKSAMIQKAIPLFANAVSSEGGEIYLRKPLSGKGNRNGATNVFDEMVFGELLSEREIKALHDSKTGKIRISFLPNIDIPFEDVVGTNGLSIPTYSGEVAGYSFHGFYFDEAHIQKVPDDFVTNESVTIYPYFAPIEYNITYHLNGGNNGDNPSTYTSQNSLLLKNASKEGYIFEGWYRTENFENKVEYLVEGSYGNIDLYAKFVRQIFKIEYVLNGGLLKEEAIESYTLDDGIIKLPNAWKPNMEFVGWYGEEEFINKVESIDSSMAKDVKLYAKFVEAKNDGDKKSPNKNNKAPVGLIIGSSIGGVVIIGAVLFVIFKFVRKKA